MIKVFWKKLEVTTDSILFTLSATGIIIFFFDIKLRVTQWISWNLFIRNSISVIP